MQFTPDANYLTVSTYMYEISVLHFRKTFKFNKAIDGDETHLSVILNNT